MKFFQHFDSRLGLTSFRGLVAESINVGLEMRRGAFVSFSGGLLKRKFLSSGYLKLRVVAAVPIDRVVFNRPNGFCNSIQEFSVVRNDNDGGFLLLQETFKPDDRVNVQMVGRLVQQKQIGRTHERTGQRDSVSPAAGKLGDLAG